MFNFRNISLGEATATALALLAASVSPLAFDWAATGAVSMHTLGIEAIVPAVIVWAVLILAAPALGWRRLATAGKLAVVGGILAVIGLETVRIIGFRVFQAMPGSMPMLMGVLLTDRFMDGPNVWSNVAGWADHFWNGIGFVFIFYAVFGRQRWWVGTLYGLAIATVFMSGPVMNLIGAGHFGQEFAPVKFPLTVYLAHIAFGSLLGWVGQHSKSTPDDLFHTLFGRSASGASQQTNT